MKVITLPLKQKLFFPFLLFWHSELEIYLKKNKYCVNTYLLLTEFEVRTVSYGSSFFFPSAKRAGHKSKGKNEGKTYSRDRENEVSEIYIISLRCA